MLENIMSCQKCNLCHHQSPLLDRPKKNAIMLVGLSAKQTQIASEIPLDNSTKSGQLVAFMEKIATQYNLKVYRTNLVKCPPLGPDLILRYPTQTEINTCFENILSEIDSLRPQIIILFGNLVQAAFKENLRINVGSVKDCSFPFQQKHRCYYVASYHPSYVMRSPLRKKRYLENFSALLDTILSSEDNCNVT